MKGKSIVLACIALATAALIAGCAGAQTSGSSSASSSTAQNSASAQASSSAGAPSSGALIASSYEWPEGKTGSVPKPETSGVITHLDVNDAAAAIGYEGMTEAEAAQYIEDLKAAGFTFDIHEDRNTSSYSFDARNAEKGGNWVQVTFLPDDGKHGGTSTVVMVMMF
ncbi:MAG: hypothetical protein IJI35_14615 [Kiritimatiellae bacterium]|nr:hypothetical protein [Kiritimatiellia bacterium]